jgi:hypothetical protein
MTVNFCCELRRFELTVFSLSLLESLICYMSDCGGKTNLAKFFSVAETPAVKRIVFQNSGSRSLKSRSRILFAMTSRRCKRGS